MKIIRYMTLTALVFISACGNNKFADDILKMQSRPIDMSVCEESSCYEAGIEKGYNGRDSAYKLVIYIDSLSCSPCFISHMYEYEEIANPEGHGHYELGHGHAHDHGGSDNAGGGIVIAE